MKTYIIVFSWVQFGDYKALHKSDWVTGSVLPQPARYGLEAHESCITGMFLKEQSALRMQSREAIVFDMNNQYGHDSFIFLKCKMKKKMFCTLYVTWTVSMLWFSK